MKSKKLTPQDHLANDNNDFTTPLLDVADYVRLRDLPLSDELAAELDRAIVVKTEQIPQDVVSMHAHCTYLDEQSGAVREIELVYPEEANPSTGKISVMSPVGSALLGLREGQEIAWDFPDGTRRILKVEKVRQSAS